MDIRLLENTDIGEAKALWKEAFGDSDTFIDRYFADKIKPGNSIGIFDGRLVSALHMIPFKICVQGRPLESAFIAGAATAKAMRGQGLMRILLLETLKLLRTRGIVMTHLYPFKHSFYENFGWATYSYVYNKYAGNLEELPAGDVMETEDLRLLAPVYSDVMSRFDGYVIRGAGEWEWRLNEHTADGGKVVMFIKNGTPAAYMLYYSDDGKAEVTETVYNEEEDIYPLLKYVLRNNTNAGYFIPAPGQLGANPYGMARVVDAQALLKLFGAEEALSHMRISDGFAAWNNVGEGIEVKADSLAKIIHRGVKDILSKEKCVICDGILEEKFLQRVTCIFEQY